MNSTPEAALDGQLGALIAALERLLLERQHLVAQPDALRSRLDRLVNQQQSLLTDLQTLLPPEGNPLV